MHEARDYLLPLFTGHMLWATEHEREPATEKTEVAMGGRNEEGKKGKRRLWLSLDPCEA